jgi:hypothetical protein
LQPPIEVSLMLQINEFSRKANTLPIEVVNEAVRHWLDTVAPVKLEELGREPLTPRFDGTAVPPFIAAEDALATCRVCEKLRRPLSNLVGRAAFTSLLQRALTLAKRESPALSGVEVRDDGSLSGFEGAATASRPVLIAHLIQLLITFIGEGLTVTLLLDNWPELKGLDEPAGKAGYER